MTRREYLTYKQKQNGGAEQPQYLFIFFTGNKDKVREIRQILGEDMPFLSVDIDTEEVQACSVEKVAKQKIIDSYQVLLKSRRDLVIKDGQTIINDDPLKNYKLILAVEDTGLGFEDCGTYTDKGYTPSWYPGALIKFFYKSLGSDSSKINKKIARMLMGSRACSTTGVGLLIEGEEPKTFLGKLESQVCYPKGSNGFDFDYILELTEGPHRGKSISELTDTEKNEISHRGKAILEMKNYLIQQAITFVPLGPDYGDRVLSTN